MVDILFGCIPVRGKGRFWRGSLSPGTIGRKHCFGWANFKVPTKSKKKGIPRKGRQNNNR